MKKDFLCKIGVHKLELVNELDMRVNKDVKTCNVYKCEKCGIFVIKEPSNEKSKNNLILFL